MWVNIYRLRSGRKVVGYGWKTKKDALKYGRIDDDCERIIVYEKTVKVPDEPSSDEEILATLEKNNTTGD